MRYSRTEGPRESAPLAFGSGVFPFLDDVAIVFDAVGRVCILELPGLRFPARELDTFADGAFGGPFDGVATACLTQVLKPFSQP